MPRSYHTLKALVGGEGPLVIRGTDESFLAAETEWRSRFHPHEKEDLLTCTLLFVAGYMCVFPFFLTRLTVSSLF
jgi:hypothetical protein